MGSEDTVRGEEDLVPTQTPDEEALRAALTHEEELDALANKRFRVGALLTLAMLVVYFGFILLIAFNKKGLGELITDGLSWAILLGVMVILITWALTWTYVGWANRVYEPEIQRLKKR
jgi:uncharacterized membrane protein (DUF485 family)